MPQFNGLSDSQQRLFYIVDNSIWNMWRISQTSPRINEKIEFDLRVLETIYYNKTSKYFHKSQWIIVEKSNQ